MKISALHIYPVKGLKGVDVPAAYVERRGLRFDRRYMVVDGDGVFISQRSVPAMALIRTSLDDRGINLRYRNGAISIPAQTREAIEVRIWNNLVEARLVDRTIDDWLSEALGCHCRLVVMPQETLRPTNPLYSQDGDHVSFADGYPLLLASESSLRDLNERLPQPVPMNRFRPSVVVSGAAPWDEDGWRAVRIGGVRFRNAKPCGRCLVTTIDQETGVSTGEEPLRTLASFRKNGNNVNFGVNLIPDDEGSIGVGDEVEVD